ncbi:MAG: diacylglycerol kinase [Bacillaceae bacterium]
MRPRARIIYNPTSGRELFKKNLPYALERFEQAGYETSAHATTGAGDATRAAEEACEEGFDVVIAVGGDGTLNEVVSGLIKYEKRPKFGIIPMGTTNDFAQAMGLKKTIEAAVDVIVNGKTVPLDIGSANDRYFINIAAGGRLTELTYEVPSKMKTVLGQLAYVMKGIEMLPSMQASHVHIEYDGESFDGEILMFFIANSSSVAGFHKLAPHASFSDGYLDLLIFKKMNIAEMLRVATLLLKGEHVNHPSIIHVKAKEIKVICSNHPIPLNLDGEYGGDTPATFKMIENCLELFVP